MNARSHKVAIQGSVVVGLAGLFMVIGLGLLGGYFLQVRDASATGTEQLKVDNSVDPAARAVVAAAAAKFLTQPVEIELGDRRTKTTWAELGMVIDQAAVAREAGRVAKSDTGPKDDLYTNGVGAGTVPVMADRAATVAKLDALSGVLSRSSENARMDLEARTIHKEIEGQGIDLYGSVSAIELAARKGASTVVLEGVAIQPDITVADLGIDDVSHVLASFTTKFSISDKFRNDNLKLAASKLDGHVIAPGEVFSFNDVVGDRTEKEGYKIAHVITSGQMVDGLAGGACQISTTLHGAAFFSGIEVVSSTPHSRPSTYVQMGLDATVVYPQVDLKLRNNYEFPVVIHYRVARGESQVEILGRERPYDKIAFERDVKKELPFDTITREDDEIPVGSMVVEQDGFPGYELKRYRKFYKDGAVVKTDAWTVRYRPVTEYVRLGINPDPNLPPPKQAKGHGPKPPSGKHFRLTQ